MTETVTVARRDLLVPDSENTRKSMDARKLEELGRSIKQSGILSPVMVHRTESGLRLVAGFRRIAAADAVLGTDYDVPYVVIEEDSLVANIVENVQREDINPVDEAYGYLELMRRGLTPKGIAGKVGVAQARVTLRLQILDLPLEVVDLIRAEKLPVSVVKSLKAIAAASQHLAKRAAKLCAGKPEWAAVLAKEPNRVVGYVAQEFSDEFFWTNRPPSYAQVRDLLTEAHRKFCDEAYADAYDGHDSHFFRLDLEDDFKLPEGYEGERSWVLSFSEHRETISNLVNREVADRLQAAAAEAKAKITRTKVEDLPEDASDAEVGAAARAEARRKEADRQKREAEAVERQAARGANLALGAILKLETSLFKGSGDELEALTEMLLDWAPLGRLGGSWIMVDESCQEEVKGKVTYAPSTQGERGEKVAEFVRGGSTAPERLGRFIAVAAANAFASPKAVAESSRFGRETCLGAATHLFEVLDGMPTLLEEAYLADHQLVERTETPEGE